MPNNVTNYIKFDGDKEAVKAILSRIRGNSNADCIDFDAIIPMPEDIYRGNLGAAEREKYGKNNWYDWSIANWGTKWNAYSQIRAADDAIVFDTAWCIPYPIYIKLAQMCMNRGVKFSGEWVNEDWSSDSGEFDCDEYGFHISTV